MPLDDLVEDLAALMGAPCILEDPEFRLLGFSDQRDVDLVRQKSILERGSTQEIRDWFYSHGIAHAEGPLRTPPDPERGIVSRICIPVRHLGRLHGFFWLLDADGAIEERRWAEAEPFAEAAGALLSLAERRQAHRDALYRELVEGGPGSARAAADELAAAAGFRLDEPVVVALIDRPDLATQLASRPTRSGLLWARESGGLCAAILRAEGRPQRSTPLREFLSSLGLSRREPELDRTTFVGIGPVVLSLDHVARARSGALVALRIARKSGEHLALWDEIGPLALLGIARDIDLAETLVPPAVARFLTAGPEALVGTAHVYLSEAASVARTAARLNLHRHTVYHRLRAIEHETELDLDTGAGRLTLHLALELAPYVLPT